MANFKLETEKLITSLFEKGDISSKTVEGLYIADGYCCSDLKYIQEGGDIDWDAMAKALNRTAENNPDGEDIWDYDDGFGLQYFSGWITFENSDTWIVREEYDGSEWWNVVSKPDIESLKKRMLKDKEYLEEIRSKIQSTEEE